MGRENRNIYRENECNNFNNLERVKSLVIKREKKISDHLFTNVIKRYNCKLSI